VIRSKASPRDKLIVTLNAEVAIRSFREADRPRLERLWSEVFPDDPKINLQVRETNRAVVEFYRALRYQIEERLSMGRALD
jgi:ribosomal protein S18 acetylase RimI-like enzyme